ncbi:MAG: Zn-ribbon domain-containing OB-fold protein [Chloroflexi bacterium]|nr:Zn-ribbon domain-containing OB-fold protein [Chloroflexota bacterium]
MPEYRKPLPVISALNRPFWEGAKKHELRFQRCNRCSKFWYPHGPVCPYCWSREYEWAKVSGRAKVTSWVVFHQRYFEGFKDEMPYSVAQVELAEGPRFLANLVGVKNEDIYIGMPVEVVFDDVTPEVTLPKFRPA